MSLRDHLKALHDEHGRITPALVVAAATDPESPLHSRFEWDDTEAARKYRLAQASDLIRSVRITFTGKSGDLKQARAYVAVRESDTVAADYIATEQALTDPLQARLVLRDFERAAKRLKAQYGHLAEFCDVLNSILGEEAA